MRRKITITVDEDVYIGLHTIAGPGNISRFVQEIIRPYLIPAHYESAYAEMAEDDNREREALEWAETTFRDIEHETR